MRETYIEVDKSKSPQLKGSQGVNVSRITEKMEDLRRTYKMAEETTKHDKTSEWFIINECHFYKNLMLEKKMVYKLRDPNNPLPEKFVSLMRLSFSNNVMISALNYWTESLFQEFFTYFT